MRHIPSYTFNSQLCLRTLPYPSSSLFFFFNDTATTEIYTLSLHDALPIYIRHRRARQQRRALRQSSLRPGLRDGQCRSEEHSSELQSHWNLVCRRLLEKTNIT